MESQAHGSRCVRKKTGRIILGGLLVLAVFLISSCWYTVNETQQGFWLLRQGNGISEAGLI
jgi:hypothetical protein